MRLQKPSDRFVKHLQNRRPLNPTGNVLIYVVVLMLIFGVLGVVMVSMFTSTTASTVTRNDSRRARYMAESGMRYAFSEMRKADFDLNHMINTLNTTTYKIGGTESFTINVFSPWFDANGTQAIGSEQNLDLEVPIGKIPPAYTFPQDSIHAINFEFTGISPTAGGSAEIEDIVAQTDTTLRLKLNDDFNAGNGERVALAVKPTGIQQVSQNGDLIVDENARSIFPRFAGAFNIRRYDYYYEELIDEGGTVRLRNITVPTESQNNLSVNSSDYVIMSPRNYLVVPTGTSDGTIYGGDYLFGQGIYDGSLIRPGSRKPDITADDLTSNLSEQESKPAFFSVDEDLDKLNIGGNQTGSFGSAFFDADMSIGGEQDYCQQGACKFALGVRAFFLLEFVNQKQGDGITFTLTNWVNNSETSVGGDIDLSELMGYAGDSRTNSAGTTFVATDQNDRGLDPPKIAVEFDTRADNDTLDYCEDPLNVVVNEHTRNDPLASNPNQDVVQYVFWGRENFLNIPCRNNPPESRPLYDDNRHDADGEEPIEEWRFEGASAQYSVWRPAIGPDGTIYVSALDANIYALNEDGSEKWLNPYSLGTPPGGNNDYMPGVDRTGGDHDGTVYSDASGDKIVAINPDGSFKWDFYFDADVDSTPVVGPDGRIYFGTNANSIGEYYLYAVDPDARLNNDSFPQVVAGEWRFLTGSDVNNVPALNSDGSVVYFVSNDNNIYAVQTSDGNELWRFPIPTEPNEITSSPTVDTKDTADPMDDVIYVGADDNYVYAFRPAARRADPNPVPPLGTFPGPGEWRFRTNGEIESSAAVDPDDGTIYIGSDDGNVWAINPNGTEKWRFPTGGNVESSPIVDFDRTIYIGSWDNRVYAINPDGSQKWFFPTGGQVPSSPALGKSGFIHIGSDDSNFYTISQFADPRNFKLQFPNNKKALLTYQDLGVAPGDLDDPNDWLNGEPGQWAVRLEVDRSLSPNPDGNFDYQLSLWIRQCQELDCSDINGTFFSDTRIDYENAPATINLPMIQNFDLKGGPLEDHDKFTRFYFGFTGAAGDEALNATISEFNLSFIRPGDPDVDVAQGDDPDWLP